jgi:hypothetical protein
VHLSKPRHPPELWPPSNLILKKSFKNFHFFRREDFLSRKDSRGEPTPRADKVFKEGFYSTYTLLVNIAGFNERLN